MENLVKEHMAAVYDFSFRLTGDKALAEDITQETFVKIWRNFDKIDSGKNIKAWIFTIARNTALDFLRKKKGIKFSEMEDVEEKIPDLEPLPDEIFSRQELGREVERALAQIRPEYREIILLHVFEELTFEEISQITTLPLNTAKSHYRRGLHQLRRFMRI